MDRRKFSSCLLMQPPCGIVKLLVCPNPSPLPLPPGHSTTKLCLPSIFIPFTQNAQCSKGSVTSGVREGGGCTRCLWKLPHGQAQDWLRHSQHYNQLELKSTNIFQSLRKKYNDSSSSIHLLLLDTHLSGRGNYTRTMDKKTIIIATIKSQVALYDQLLFSPCAFCVLLLRSSIVSGSNNISVQNNQRVHTLKPKQAP